MYTLSMPVVPEAQAHRHCSTCCDSQIKQVSGCNPNNSSLLLTHHTMQRLQAPRSVAIGNSSAAAPMTLVPQQRIPPILSL
jgi:hypothetical protein